MLKSLWKYRDLLRMLIVRDIRIRYKQAAMGFLWAIFMPMVAAAAGVLIKQAMALVSGQEMDFQGVSSILVKVIPWTFFISALRFSVQSLVANANLVQKIYFPRAVLPLASTVASFFDFLIAMVVMVVFLTIAQIGVSVYLLIYPILLVALFFFTAGLGLLLSSANLFFRDVKYVVETILMFGIFFTPVFYSAETFGSYGFLLMLNPIGSVLESMNSIVIDQQFPDPFWFAYAIISSFLTFALGVQIFNHYEPWFAENV